MKTIDGLTHSARSPEQWAALPTVACACGQRFRQQVAGTAECDDCISTDPARWPTYAAVTRGGDTLKSFDTFKAAAKPRFGTVSGTAALARVAVRNKTTFKAVAALAVAHGGTVGPDSGSYPQLLQVSFPHCLNAFRDPKHGPRCSNATTAGFALCDACTALNNRIRSEKNAMKKTTTPKSTKPAAAATAKGLAVVRAFAARVEKDTRVSAAAKAKGRTVTIGAKPADLPAAQRPGPVPMSLAEREANKAAIIAAAAAKPSTFAEVSEIAKGKAATAASVKAAPVAAKPKGERVPCSKCGRDNGGRDCRNANACKNRVAKSKQVAAVSAAPVAPKPAAGKPAPAKGDARVVIVGQSKKKK